MKIVFRQRQKNKFANSQFANCDSATNCTTRVLGPVQIIISLCKLLVYQSFSVAVSGNIVVLKATCDNRMSVYVDGEYQYASNLNKYNILSTIVIPSGNFKVIAIKCVDIGQGEGLLASAEDYLGELVLLSDATWKCSEVLEEGWEQVNFIASSENWKNAVDIGEKSWSVKGQVSPYADWIWTENRVDTIYCRAEMPWERGLFSFI